MQSSKFKIGSKVYYKSFYDDKKRYGIVCSNPHGAMGLWTGKEVWASWDNNGYPTWANEKDVRLAEPRYKRNLPEWW